MRPTRLKHSKTLVARGSTNQASIGSPARRIAVASMLVAPALLRVRAEPRGTSDLNGWILLGSDR